MILKNWKKSRSCKRAERATRLRFEALEDRQLLSVNAIGLEPFGGAEVYGPDLPVSYTTSEAPVAPSVDLSSVKEDVCPTALSTTGTDSVFTVEGNGDYDYFFQALDSGGSSIVMNRDYVANNDSVEVFESSCKLNLNGHSFTGSLGRVDICGEFTIEDGTFAVTVDNFFNVDGELTLEPSEANLKVAMFTCVADFAFMPGSLTITDDDNVLPRGTYLILDAKQVSGIFDFCGTINVPDGWEYSVSETDRTITATKTIGADLTDVSISGDAWIGGELTATAYADGDLATADYKWYCGDELIASTQTCYVKEAYFGKELRVEATGNGNYGSTVSSTTTIGESPSTTVTRFDDVEDSTDGIITLREAVGYTAANGTINIPVGTCILNSVVDINKNVKIEGADQETVFVDGKDATQIFNVNSDATLELDKITLQNGYASNGGAIFNDGTLILGDVTFSKNASSNFGGALSNYGTTTVKSGATATFADNSATKYGGAYFGCGNFTVEGTVNFSDNNATGEGSKGGAIYNDYNPNKASGGVVSISGNASFANNSALYRGGAIQSYGDASTDYYSLSIANATFTGNSAEYGGAIDVGKSAKASFSGSVTLTGNNATFGGALYSAGAISFDKDGTYTFTNNAASRVGGAINACNYEKSAGTDYVAGLLALAGTFSFVGNTATGSGEYDGLGGAVATAARTTINDANFNWGDGNYAERGSCVAVDTDLIVDALDFGEYPNGLKGAYSTFIVLEKEIVSSAAVFTPKMLAPSAVAAKITVEGVSATFGKEGVSAQELGLGAGNYEALVQYTNEDGTTSSVYSLVLTVESGASLEVRETSVANGRGVKFDFNVTKETGRAVALWEIDWNDGTTTKSENLSNSWMAAHYYAEDGIYDATLTVVYIDGKSETFKAFSTLKIGAGSQSKTFSAVFAAVDDVFEELDDLIPYGPALR